MESLPYSASVTINVHGAEESDDLAAQHASGRIVTSAFLSNSDVWVIHADDDNMSLSWFLSHEAYARFAARNPGINGGAT